MIKKTKHPSNKAERRAIELAKSQRDADLRSAKIRKKLHKGASPVAKLLNDKEIQDAAGTDNRSPVERRDVKGLGGAAS